MTNPAPPIGAVTTPTAAPDRVQARAHLSASADAYPLETVLISAEDKTTSIE